MPDNIDENRLSYPLPTNLDKNILCHKCNKKFDVKAIYNVKLKYLVDYEENRSHPNTNT